MTIPAIITAARASIAGLTIVPQPMASHDHAERMVRKDALAILDEMAAQIEVVAAQSFAMAAAGEFEQEDYVKELPE